jgi:hypothetical protein
VTKITSSSTTLQQKVSSGEFIKNIVNSFGVKKGEEIVLEGTANIQCIEKEKHHLFYVIIPVVKIIQKMSGEKFSKLLTKRR